MTEQSLSFSVFSAGNVLGRGFSIFFKNIVPFMLLSFLVYSPIIVYTALIDTSYDNPDLVDTIYIWGIVVVVLAVPLNMLVTATLVYGTFQELRGQRVSIGACVIRGIGRIFPALIVAVLVTICILAGFVALIIPGFIVMTMLWVAIPVAVVERPGLMPSLKRSADLTSGYRWPIFGIIVLFSIFEPTFPRWHSYRSQS